MVSKVEETEKQSQTRSPLGSSRLAEPWRRRVLQTFSYWRR